MDVRTYPDRLGRGMGDPPENVDEHEPVDNSVGAPMGGAGVVRPPAVQLHCARALTARFSAAQASERARVVLQSAPRMPAVGFYGGPYGTHWYTDAIALPHNAVRRQLYDAFVIANALEKMALDIVEADLARVYAWLGSFDRFLGTIFDAEERFLYPLVDNALRKLAIPQPPDFVLLQRTATKHNILDLLSAARKTRDVATGEIRGRIIALRYALDRFGEAILDYFAFTEGFIPKLFKAGLKHGEKEKDKLEKHIFDHLLKQPHGGMLGALLMQCIESRVERAEFINRNIRREKERDMFREHIKTVEARHMQLATTFDQLALKYERTFGVSTFMRYSPEDLDPARAMQLIGDVDLNDE